MHRSPHCGRRSAFMLMLPIGHDWAHIPQPVQEEEERNGCGEVRKRSKNGPRMYVFIQAKPPGWISEGSDGWWRWMQGMILRLMRSTNAACLLPAVASESVSNPGRQTYVLRI